MKKILAVIMTLVFLLGTVTTAMATNSGTTVLPEKSTYEFNFQLPNYIITEKDTNVAVTFNTLVLGAGGYTNIRYEISTSTAPDSGTVTFIAKDNANQTITFSNNGVFTPAANFTLPAVYNTTTNWTMNFSKAGTYTINFKAYDGANYKIAEASQQIAVANGAFIFTVPSNIIAAEEKTINVTLVTEQDYSNVHYAFLKTAGAGDVIFKTKDVANTWYTFTNSGIWTNDLNVTGPYNVSTPWNLTFSQAGTYTISFRLESQTNEILAQGSQEIIVKEAAEVDEDDDDRLGKTHGLLNALRNHLKDKKNTNEKVRANSITRLMELLQQRNMTLAEINAALGELQTAVAANDGTADDFRALGKMHELRGEKLCTYANGKRVEYDTEPIVENERTLVPFRKIAEALGAEVQWIAAEKKIIVTKGTTSVTIILGEGTATIDKNGVKTTVTLDVSAKLYKNRTMVPLRFLAEALDTTVDYYPEGALVVIKTKAVKQI